MSCAQCVAVHTGYTTDAPPSLAFPAQYCAFNSAGISPSMGRFCLVSPGPSLFPSVHFVSYQLQLLLCLPHLFLVPFSLTIWCLFWLKKTLISLLMRNLTPIKEKKKPTKRQQTLAHNKTKEILGIFLDLLFWLWKETLLLLKKMLQHLSDSGQKPLMTAVLNQINS